MTDFGDRNPADVLDEPMWQMFKTFGQKPNIEALKKYVYDLIQMSTQKTAGQRDKKTDLNFEDNLHMTLWGIVIEASALVQSGILDGKELTTDGGAKYTDGEIRCTCGKLLGHKENGVIGIWCKRCRRDVNISAESQ